MTTSDKPISPQTAYYRRLTPEAKAAQVEANRKRKAARSPDQIAADKRRANEAHTAWKLRNPERSKMLRDRATVKMYSDPDKRPRLILTKIKARAKAKGLDFNLTVDDIVIPSLCPVLGIPISVTYQLGRKAAHAWDSPSVDRVDNSKGYVKGNIRIISNRANLLKGAAELSELERIVSYMRGDL